MSVGVESDLDARVAHLVPDVRGSFALRNQLTGEEVPEVMKASACHAGLFCDWLPHLCVELIRVYEAVAIAWEDKSAVGFSDLQIGQHHHHALGSSDAA